VTIQVTGTGGTGSAALSFFIAAADPVIALPTVATKPKAVGRHGKVTLKGSATDAVKVEVKAGKGGFKGTKGSPSHWTFKAKGLKAGQYKFTVRATNANGQATLKKVKVQVKG
jgi:hypothetical protein